MCIRDSILKAVKNVPPWKIPIGRLCPRNCQKPSQSPLLNRVSISLWTYYLWKALVRWAAGKRLTNRLPKLSLITLSPPLNRGIIGLRMGPYVPTPKFFTISGDPGRVICQVLDMRKYYFLSKAFSWWTWDSNSRPTTHGLSSTPFCEGISPLGYW